jgi:hypothetical protein
MGRKHCFSFVCIAYESPLDTQAEMSNRDLDNDEFTSQPSVFQMKVLELQPEETFLLSPYGCWV